MMGEKGISQFGCNGTHPLVKIWTQKKHQLLVSAKKNAHVNTPSNHIYSSGIGNLMVESHQWRLLHSFSLSVSEYFQISLLRMQLLNARSMHTTHWPVFFAGKKIQMSKCSDENAFTCSGFQTIVRHQKLDSVHLQRKEHGNFGLCGFAESYWINAVLLHGIQFTAFHGEPSETCSELMSSTFNTSKLQWNSFALTSGRVSAFSHALLTNVPLRKHLLYISLHLGNWAGPLRKYFSARGRTLSTCRASNAPKPQNMKLKCNGCVSDVNKCQARTPDTFKNSVMDGAHLFFSTMYVIRTDTVYNGCSTAAPASCDQVWRHFTHLFNSCYIFSNCKRIHLNLNSLKLRVELPTLPSHL